MTNHAQLAAQICETGRRLYERGLIAATEGNISCRLDDGRVLCTPTMVSKGYMTPTDLCVVDMQGRLIEGTRAATSEILLHIQAYKANPHTGAVLHCHPPHATAFAVRRTPLPSGVLAEAEYFLGEIPTLDYRDPGTAEFASLIAPHARARRCALLKYHGAVSWDRDLDRARSWMEILEAYCRTIILAKQLGGMSPLPGAAIARLRKSGRDL